MRYCIARISRPATGECQEHYKNVRGRLGGILTSLGIGNSYISELAFFPRAVTQSRFLISNGEADWLIPRGDGRVLRVIIYLVRSAAFLADKTAGGKYVKRGRRGSNKREQANKQNDATV